MGFFLVDIFKEGKDWFESMSSESTISDRVRSLLIISHDRL